MCILMAVINLCTSLPIFKDSLPSRFVKFSLPNFSLHAKLKCDTGIRNFSVFLLSLKWAVKPRCSFMTLYDNVYLLILGVIWQPGWKTIKCAGNFPFPLAQQSVIRALDFIYLLFRSLPEVWPQNQSICLQANCSKCNCIIVFFSCRAYGIWFFACFF